jgi:hypothetical protein
MKSLLKFLTITIALSITGCGALYDSSAAKFMATQPESAWGSQPPKDHQEQEMRYLNAILKDPYSAKIEFLPVKRTTVAASITNPTVVPVWESAALVNAKNSYGGYTGAKKYSFYWKNGSLYLLIGEGLIQHF